MKIYCYGCQRNVEPYQTSGATVLPKETHLKKSIFWKCPDCSNFVGTRTVKQDNFAAAGAIPTKAIRKIQNKLRTEIKFILDAKSSTPNAKEILYDWLSKKLFYRFRISGTTNIKDLKKVEELLKIIKEKC